MASHHQPHLIIDNTHRVVSLPDDWCAEHLQIEQGEPRLYTGDETAFVFFFGGLIGSLVTCGAAWLIAEFAL